MQHLRKCSWCLSLSVLLLVHRLNPDVGLVGEYVKLKLLELLCLVKGGDACEHIVHAGGGGGGGGTNS